MIERSDDRNIQNVQEDQTVEMQAMNERVREAMTMSRQQLLNRINEVSFAVNDMQLYLDTHPDSRRALRYMERHQEERKALLNAYARRFGPLTMDSAVMSDDETWKWSQQPFPWQQEGGCR